MGTIYSVIMTTANAMRMEVTSAANFLANLLRARECCGNRLEVFSKVLTDLLCEHYQSHWFPEAPFRGSGYRCLRFNFLTVDPLCIKAGEAAGLSVEVLQTCLPRELTIWVDPSEVSYRIGEEGSVCVLYDGKTDTLLPEAAQTDFLQNCKNQFISFGKAQDSTDFNFNGSTPVAVAAGL